MNHLPLGLKVKGRICLVAGGGAAAVRKARLLYQAGARLRIVAAEIDPELCELVRRCDGECLLRPWRSEDCEGAVLVVAANEESVLDREIAAAADMAGILCNVVDDFQASSVIFPAIVRRSPLWIAISSGGAAPMLARYWRMRIEALVPEGWGRLAHLAERMLSRVRRHIPETAARRHFWERILQGPIPGLLLAGRERQGEEAFVRELETPVKQSGEVYLVGAGPGNPDLLTLRALQLMQQADVVLYDRLIPESVLERLRRDAERIYVGKSPKKHPVSQGEIHELLIKHARCGRRVLRLKGGDPFIFGRGGEEIEQLSAAGIPFELVPGVSAASGCASYAGIPLTHRDYSSSVRFLSGHLRDEELRLPWAELALPGQTLVFYMSAASLPLICKSLLAHGADPKLPAAVIERGCMPGQRVIEATLPELPEQAADIRSPSLLIVGEVVRLRIKLRWQ